jgi:nitrite reductase/ring-hydroxylating ferredoxin subunit
MTAIRVNAGPLATLGADEARAVPLPRGADRRPREALLVRGSDGHVRAYLNLCRHLPVPIDGGSRNYLTKDRQHLLCGTHGALYQRDDGKCIAGPCLHLQLIALAIELIDGEIFIVDADPVP